VYPYATPERSMRRTSVRRTSAFLDCAALPVEFDESGSSKTGVAGLFGVCDARLQQAR
jgi:hypothetical protein